MVALTLALFAILLGAIGLLFNFCHTRLRDFEADLPRRVSYDLGNLYMSTPTIITKLKERLSLDIEKTKLSECKEWMQEYRVYIRDLFIVKMLFFFSICLIIGVALFYFSQM